MEFKNIKSTILDSKCILESCKTKYFDSCKSGHQQEEIIKKLVEQNYQKHGSKKSSDEELIKARGKLFNQENLLRYREIAENYSQIYKKEISKTNTLYEDCDNAYFPLIEKFRSQEESRIYFLKYHLEKFSNYLSMFRKLN